MRCYCSYCSKIGYTLESPNHTVVGEGGRVDGAQKTGTLSAQNRMPLCRVAVKLATKRFSVHGVPQQPFALNFQTPRATLDGMSLIWDAIFKAGLAVKNQLLTAICTTQITRHHT